MNTRAQATAWEATPQSQHVVFQQEQEIPGPMSATYHHPVIVQPQSNEGAIKYKARSGRASGVVQLTCAVASIVFGSVELILGSQVSVIGFGIWGGLLFFLPAGILGIVSQSKNKCVIIAYMVMSILAAITGFTVVFLGTVAAIVSADQACGFQELCNPDAQESRIAVDSILAIVGFIEFVTAIVGASLCCAGVCCESCSNNTHSVITHYQANAAPMIVTTGTSYATPYIPPPWHGFLTQASYPQSSSIPPTPSSYVHEPPPQYNLVAGGYPGDSKTF